MVSLIHTHTHRAQCYGKKFWTQKDNQSPAQFQNNFPWERERLPLRWLSPLSSQQVCSYLSKTSMTPALHIPYLVRNERPSCQITIAVVPMSTCVTSPYLSTAIYEQSLLLKSPQCQPQQETSVHSLQTKYPNSRLALLTSHVVTLCKPTHLLTAMLLNATT